MIKAILWISQNLDTIQQGFELLGAAIFGLIGFASFIAKLTPSQADNAFLDKLIGWLHAIGLNPSAEKARPAISEEQGGGSGTTLNDTPKMFMLCFGLSLAFTMSAYAVDPVRVAMPNYTGAAGSIRTVPDMSGAVSIDAKNRYRRVVLRGINHTTFGNFSGPVVIQESDDGTNWCTIGVQLATTGAFVTSLTADGCYYWQSELPNVRVRWTRNSSADANHLISVRFVSRPN